MSRKANNSNKAKDVVEESNVDATVPGGAVNGVSASNDQDSTVDVITAENDVTEPVAEVSTPDKLTDKPADKVVEDHRLDLKELKLK